MFTVLPRQNLLSHILISKSSDLQTVSSILQKEVLPVCVIQPGENDITSRVVATHNNLKYASDLISEDLKETATNAARWEPALNTLQVHTSSFMLSQI